MRQKVKVECNCQDIPSLEEQYQDIMTNFDFKHVHMMMNWNQARVEYDDNFEHLSYHPWTVFRKPCDNFTIEDVFDPKNNKIPTIDELKKDANQLLKQTIRFAKANPRSKFYMTAIGPFKATYRYGVIELECVFESWSCD